MYQVTFSNQSMMELNKLPAHEQMDLIETLSSVDPEDPGSSNNLGSFSRNGTIFYRLRPKGLRIYFEILEESILFCHYILQQHTLTDFIFRFKLPVSEEQMLEQHQSFWKYLETLTK